jgi:hypothetical protein
MQSSRMAQMPKKRVRLEKRRRGVGVLMGSDMEVSSEMYVRIREISPETGGEEGCPKSST